MMKHFLTRSSWTRADYFMLILLIVGVSHFWMIDAIGRFEGKYDPVVSGYQITQTLDDGAGVVIHGQFNLIRSDCSFDRIDWRLVGDGRTVAASVVFVEGAKTRHEGLNKFGPWRLNFDRASLYRSVAVVYHTCPWRPWPVITHLYP